MKKLLIFLGILIFSINNGFSQDMKQYLEKKAQLHIDSVYSNAIAIGIENADFFGDSIPRNKPYMWKWKGYETPIYTDSLVCENPIIMKWAEEELKLPYDTLTLIERERRIPVIKVDTVSGKIILCILHSRVEDGGNSMYSQANSLLEDNYYSDRDTTIIVPPSLEGYWWVGNKCVLITGNCVDLFFERYKNQRMGSPLPPHMTIDDNYDQNLYGGSTNGVYWSYKNQKIKKCYFEKKGKKSVSYYHRVSVYDRESYYEKLKKSFNHNNFKK